MLKRPLLLSAAALGMTVALAACGGGGGGGGVTLPPAINGQIASSVGTQFGNSQVLFSCGCTGQAGSITTDAQGNFTINVQSTAVPASPSPIYTIAPGRSYVIVGQNSTGAQAWTMEFTGKDPSRNLNLYGKSDINVADQYTTATSLYVFYLSQSFTGDQAFDRWNFNALSNFTQTLKASQTGTNSAEQHLLADIATAQQSNQSLYPAVPLWDPVANATPNATIVADVQAVQASGDTALPTPCPTNGCTNVPTP